MSSALEAAYTYFVIAVEEERDLCRLVPTPLLAQARLAASAHISFTLLLRRCTAINSLLTLYVIQESDKAAVSDNCKFAVLRTQAIVFDRVIEAMDNAYSAELIGGGSIATRELSAVKELVAGGPADRWRLPYELGGWHLAVILRGEATSSSLRSLSRVLDARLLVVQPGDSIRWAWIGVGQVRNHREVRKALKRWLPVDAPVAFGCWERGVAGWRATHAQAKAAFAISLRVGSALHYEDVALEASTMRDPVLSSFLQSRYVDPISRGRHGEETLPDTLRAYFAVHRNGVSASATLGVSRQTVGNRLHAVEEKLGCSLQPCASNLELAFRLEALEHQARG